VTGQPGQTAKHDNQNRTKVTGQLWTRPRQQGQDSEKAQPEQNNRDRTVRLTQRDIKTRREQQGKDSHRKDQDSETGLSEQNNRDRKARTRQRATKPEQNSRDRTAMDKTARQDNQNRTGGTGQP
jgi:hypothetical protein